MRFCLGHNAQNRLGPTLAQKDASVVTELCFHIGNSLFDLGAFKSFVLIGDDQRF